MSTQILPQNTVTDLNTVEVNSTVTVAGTVNKSDIFPTLGGPVALVAVTLDGGSTVTCSITDSEAAWDVHNAAQAGTPVTVTGKFVLMGNDQAPFVLAREIDMPTLGNGLI